MCLPKVFYIDQLLFLYWTLLCSPAYIICVLHYNDVIMSAMASQITSLTIQAQIKENIKALRHRPLWREFTGHKGPVTRNTFPFDDVIMLWLLQWHWADHAIDPVTVKLPCDAWVGISIHYKSQANNIFTGYICEAIITMCIPYTPYHYWKHHDTCVTTQIEVPILSPLLWPIAKMIK